MDEHGAKERRNPLVTAATVLGMVFAIGGPLLSVVGAMTHDFYLDALGAPYGLFPLTVEQSIRLGAIAVADRSFVSHEVFAAHWWLGLVAIVLTALCLTIPKIATLFEGGHGKRIRGGRDWVQFLLKSVLAGTFAYLAPTGLFLMLAVALALPMLIGRSAGLAMADEARQRFSKPCDTPNNPCQVVHTREGRLEGYIAEAGPAAVALVDPKTRQLFVIIDNEIRFQTVRPRSHPIAP